MTQKNLFKTALAMVLVVLLLAFVAFILHPDGFPIHFNHAGQYARLLPRHDVFYYPLIALCITSVLMLVAQFSKGFAAKKKLRPYYAPFAATMLSVAIACSISVGLTKGNHIFMYSEVLSVVSIIAFIITGETKKR